MSEQVNLEAATFGFPVAVRAPRAAEMDAAALARLARERAFDAAALDGDEPFFFPGEISSNRVDAYHTRMRPSSLKNYAEDAAAGVALLANHSSRSSMPLGQSLTGRFTGPGGDGVAHVRAEFFSVPGLEGSPITSDALIRGIRLGVYRDLSIGFFGGRHVCSICGLDIYRNWDCPHVPGFEYDVSRNGRAGFEVCIADIEDARLAEVSVVFDGATPGASVLKALQEAEAGRLTPEAARSVVTRFRLRHPDEVAIITKSTRRFSPGHSSEEDPAMATTANDDAKEQGGANRANEGEGSGAKSGGCAAPAGGERAGEAGDSPKPGETPAEGGGEGAGREQAAFTDEELRAHEPVIKRVLVVAGVGEVANLAAGVRALASQAADGRAYRESLVEEAVAEGTRALGANFNAESYRRLLEGSSVETIKLMRDDWARQAKAQFGGGRQIDEENGAGKDPAAGEQQQETAAPGLPADVYQ